MLSLGVVNSDVEIGTEVTLVWGEENGGSAKPVVERHRQVEIRAIVSPCPYSEVARTGYAEGLLAGEGDRLAGELEQRGGELVRRGEIRRVVGVELDHASRTGARRSSAAGARA